MESEPERELGIIAVGMIENRAVLNYIHNGPRELDAYVRLFAFLKANDMALIENSVLQKRYGHLLKQNNTEPGSPDAHRTLEII